MKLKGEVKWFNSEKRFGFLSRSQGSDVFVHMSEVEKAGLSTLREGQVCSFEVRHDPKKDKECAVNLSFDD